MTVTLNSDEKLVGYTETNRGDPEDAYDPKELTEKFFELTHRVWLGDVAKRVFDNLTNLDHLKDINDLTRPLDGVTI